MDPELRATTGVETSEERVQLHPELSSERQRQMRFWIAVVAVMGIASWLGVFGVARLANDAPLLLIVLSPLIRHLMLVAASVGTVEFLAVAWSRTLFSCAVACNLGRAVGPAGLDWLDGNSPSVSRFMRWIERLFSRSAIVAMLVWPSFAVAMLAGVSGLRLASVLIWCGIGLLIRLSLILVLGQAFMEPIQWLLDVIDTNWKEVTLTMIVAWAAYRGIRRLRQPVPHTPSTDSTSPARSDPPAPPTPSLEGS